MQVTWLIVQLNALTMGEGFHRQNTRIQWLSVAHFSVLVIHLRECMNQHRIHQFFEISVLLQGAHALIECIGGLVLSFVSTSAIYKSGPCAHPASAYFEQNGHHFPWLPHKY